MFPIGCLLLAILLVWPLGEPSRRVRRTGTAAATFLLTCAPLIALVSQHEGRLSLGETGRLNYAWYVNHLEPYWQGWTGDGGSPGTRSAGSAPPAIVVPTLAKPTHGTPTHPPRILFDRPRVLEFSAPVGGTYPLWFDPSYWYEGARTRLELRQQIRTFVGNLAQCKPMTSLLACALVILAVGLWRGARQGAEHTVSSVAAWPLLWPVAVCCLYAAVHVESRFFAGFLVIFWLAVARLPVLRLPVAPALLAAVLLVFLGSVVRNMKAVPLLQAADTRIVAANLKAIGVRAGDRVAVVGNGLDSYYARLARVRIVAEGPNPGELWSRECGGIGILKEKLRNAGVKVLIAEDQPDGYACAGWRDVPGTLSKRFSMLILGESPEFALNASSASPPSVSWTKR